MSYRALGTTAGDIGRTGAAAGCAGAGAPQAAAICAEIGGAITEAFETAFSTDPSRGALTVHPQSEMSVWIASARYALSRALERILRKYELLGLTREEVVIWFTQNGLGIIYVQPEEKQGRCWSVLNSPQYCRVGIPYELAPPAPQAGYPYGTPEQRQGRANPLAPVELTQWGERLEDLSVDLAEGRWKTLGPKIVIVPALQQELELGKKDEGSIWPWLLGAAAVGGGWYLWKRRKR